MYPFSRAWRARVAATVAVVVTALTVAVPLLDRGEAPGVVAFSEPGATPGYVEHDHSVCLQHGQSAWQPVAVTELPAERFVRQADSPCRAIIRSRGAPASPHHSRAPPIV